MKGYKERHNFILRTTPWKYLVAMQNPFEECTSKSKLCNDKSYIKKLRTRYKFLCMFPHKSLMVTQPRFQ